MKVYVAGPMTGYPDHNVPAFDAATAKLRSLLFHVVSPPDVTRSYGVTIRGINSDGTIDPAAYCQLVKLDIQAMLQDCERIYVLPGWRESKGAKLEVAIGLACGMKIYDFETLEKINISALITIVP